MIRIAWVRGKYLNAYEGQNYDLRDPELSLTGFSSMHPLDEHVPFPLEKLWSPADGRMFHKAAKYIANRTIGDLQLLTGLERAVMDYDILHTADPHYYYSFQLARVRDTFTNKRLIVTWWETIPFNNESALAKKDKKQYVMKRTDRFICYTDAARQAVLREGVSDDRISVVPLGVDLKRFGVKRKKKSDVPVILFVGRMVEEKGVRDLFDAFKSLPRGSAKLRLVGNGPLAPELFGRAELEGMSEHVEIMESDYAGMPAVYADADIFVLPSKPTSTWEEQFGMVLAEAMAAGLPVVTTNTGAIAEVVGDAAVVMKPGDTQQLAEAMRRLVQKPEARTKLSHLATARAKERFDSTNTARIIGTIYKNEKRIADRRDPGPKRRT